MIRPPVIIDPVLLEEKFIFYEITPKSNYFNNLVGELGETNPRQAVEDKASEATGTGLIFTEANLYTSIFSNFDKIESYLFKNIEVVTKSQLKNEAEALIGGTLSAFLGQANYLPAKSKTWDSIFHLKLFRETKDSYKS